MLFLFFYVHVYGCAFFFLYSLTWQMCDEPLASRSRHSPRAVDFSVHRRQHCRCSFSHRYGALLERSSFFELNFFPRASGYWQQRQQQQWRQLQQWRNSAREQWRCDSIGWGGRSDHCGSQTASNRGASCRRRRRRGGVFFLLSRGWRRKRGRK